MAKCKECEGKGYIPTRATLGKQRMPWRIYNKECPRCKGTGIEPKDKKEVADKERGVFTKPTPAQCRKVAAVIRKGGK